MPKKKPTKIDNDNEYDIDEDIVIEDDSIAVSGTIKKIREKLKECEKERQENLDGWQRARADAVNKEKETLLERDRAVSRAEDRIFTELFPILDSFDMAFSNKDVWESVDENWRIGIEHIHTQAMRVFEQGGITAIDEDGVEFDPNIHEQVKIEAVESAEEDNKIHSVIQKGYQKGDQVLRPAKVIIGKFK